MLLFELNLLSLLCLCLWHIVTFPFCRLCYRVSQKWNFLRVDNFATVIVVERNVCDLSKVFKFYLEKKYKTCI